MLTDSLDTIRMPPCALAHLNLQIEKWSDINKQEKIKGRVQLVNIWRKEDLPSIENNHKSNSLQISTMHNIRIQVYSKIHLWDNSKI